MGLHSKHGGDSIQRDAEGHGALGTQAARSHTSGKMPNSWDGAEPSPRHRTEQEHPHPRRERWAAPSLHACSQEAAGPSFSRGRAVQCRAGGCRAGAVRRLGQLPMDAEDTVPHGELRPSQFRAVFVESLSHRNRLFFLFPLISLLLPKILFLPIRMDGRS